jgi:putative DNA methylase
MTTPYRKKLIEVALPLEAINREAAREKSIRHGHPSTLHLWWARRPLAACRAVIFASLVDDPSECVPELMANPIKRRAAENEFKAQKKEWDALKALFDKASSAGMSAVPLAPEPKLEFIIAESERQRLFRIIEDLVKWENSNNEGVLNAAREEILRSTDGNPPPIYDPFCGGGSIPLEAQRLGLEAHASDLNPVPVLITKALIELPPKFAGRPPINPEARQANVFDGTSRAAKRAKKDRALDGTRRGADGLADDVRYYGSWMRDHADQRIGQLYPKIAVVRSIDGKYRHATPDEMASKKAEELTVIAWLWARTVASPNPAAKGGHVPLVRSFWLSMKPAKRTWTEPVVDAATMTFRFETRTGTGEPRGATVNRNGAECILTGSPIPLDYIRSEAQAGRMGTRLMAIVAEGQRERVFLAPTAADEALARTAVPAVSVPETDMPKDALGFRVQNYGMVKHRHLFTNRQLVAMTTFCDLVLEAREQVLLDSGGEQEYADAVATYLALGVGRCADFWNTLATWSWQPKNELVGHAFGRQALPITWDFGEINPFSDSGGNFTGNLEFTAKALARTPACGIGVVKQLNAAEVKGALYCFSTDPPYYDNVPYADLSDFFYVWLRKCLQPVYPKLLGTVLVPKAEELVAEPFRHGGREKARQFFEQGMRHVFERMREFTDERFPATIYYAFKQTEDDEDEVADADAATTRASTGWETFLQGLADAGWQIDGTWPMRTERSGRLRDNASNALASSIILVCRPRPQDAGIASRRDFLAALRRELPEALRHLQKGNIAPVDLAQAAIGPGMAVFSRYAGVLENDGTTMRVRTALTLINGTLDEVLAEQEGEFDGDTRWALAWFDQYGFAEGPYGVAETLCTAKNTAVSAMSEAGILVAKAGKVRLLRTDELAYAWDPNTDNRFTIWEATHHLVRALDTHGEEGAAKLTALLGGSRAELARDLSYRLYTLCERRKWAKDALQYNALVQAWPEATRLAASKPTVGTFTQKEML